jgi:hypothetical protein
MDHALPVVTDDKNRRVMLCFGADSRLEALNEGRMMLGQIIEQRTEWEYHEWEWEIHAQEIAEPVAGWAAVAEHHSSERKGQPFASVS